MSEFDSIMVRVEIGGNRKLRRFTPEERWCVIAGVWALAAKSPIRGYLMISDKLPVEEQDIAEQAGVKAQTVRSTLKKMRDLGMLEVDSELEAEHVHDWHTHQAEPKPSETKDAWRKRKREQRERKANGGDVTGNVPRDVTADSHAPPEGGVTPLREEKRREEKFPQPPRGQRVRDREQFEEECQSLAGREFPGITAAPGLVRAAISDGAKSIEAVRGYVERWDVGARQTPEAVA